MQNFCSLWFPAMNSITLYLLYAITSGVRLVHHHARVFVRCTGCSLHTRFSHSCDTRCSVPSWILQLNTSAAPAARVFYKICGIFRSSRSICPMSCLNISISFTLFYYIRILSDGWCPDFRPTRILWVVDLQYFLYFYLNNLGCMKYSCKISISNVFPNIISKF